MALRKQEHIEQITKRCLIAQKKFSFKERAERDSKYWCKGCQRVYRQFSAPSARVFVFNLCLENYFNENSRVTCNKQLKQTQITRVYNPVRRTFYDVNYIYVRFRAQQEQSIAYYSSRQSLLQLKRVPDTMSVHWHQRTALKYPSCLRFHTSRQAN